MIVGIILAYILLSPVIVLFCIGTMMTINETYWGSSVFGTIIKLILFGIGVIFGWWIVLILLLRK